MAAGPTRYPIATTTLTSAVASYTFSSIPSTYTDLVLVATIKGSTNDDTVLIQFNSDTGTNYSNSFIYGTSSATGSQRQSGQTAMRIGSGNTNTNFDGYIANIHNYSNSVAYKTVGSRENASSNLATATAGLWRSSSVITSILIKRGSGNIEAGSTLTLYGIQAA
jgi:hypothetical protein